MRASRQSDIAEKLKVESLMRGRTDDTMPMDFEDMRHLEVTGNKWLTTVQKSLDALGEFPRGTNVPALYAPDAKRLLRGLTRIFAVPGTEGSGAVKGYQQGAFWLPGIPVPPEALANASRRSYEALIAYGKTMGVSDDVIARYMSQWAVSLRGDRTASMKWFTSWWEGMLDAAPNITPAGKAQLQKLWDTAFDQYGSDFIRTTKRGGYADAEPLMYTTVVDEVTGTKHKAPAAVFCRRPVARGVPPRPARAYVGAPPPSCRSTSPTPASAGSPACGSPSSCWVRCPSPCPSASPAS